ncbi:hypothetical protein PRIPAC_92360, partial [Pristionchus pacificus]|uniref:Uncharacterized protein n=1 Tax=Pristionchus pacificus TaxID=54126 RepID=A0A2A6CD95_PRIPA
VHYLAIGSVTMREQGNERGSSGGGVEEGGGMEAVIMCTRLSACLSSSHAVGDKSCRDFLRNPMFCYDSLVAQGTNTSAKFIKSDYSIVDQKRVTEAVDEKED